MCTCPSQTPKLSLPLILTPATISSFSKSVSLKVPPKKSISLELLPIDLHCFSSIHHWPHTNPPVPSSPNKDHMLPQICQKKKNPSLPTSLFFFRLSISFSNHSWGVTIWRPLISLMRSGHPLFWNLHWLPRASRSSSSLVWYSRPSSVCPNEFCFFFSATLTLTLLFSKTHLIIFPGIPYVFPASTPICKMPLPGTPSLFPLHQDLSLPSQRSSLLVLNAVCCSRKEGWC